MCAATLGGPAVARAWDEIERTRTFEICAQSDDLPYFDDTGERRGALYELSEAVARKLDVALKVAWIFSADFIRKTSCDAIPAVAAIGDDDTLRLTEPYLSIRTIVVVPSAHAPVHGIDDLRHDRVGVLADSWARHVLNQQGLELRVRFLENEAVLDAVAAGDVDAGVVTLLAYDWYMHRHPGLALRAEENFIIDPDFDYVVAFGLRRADEQLATKVGGILKNLIDDGTLARIFASYGLRYTPPPRLAK